MRTTETTISFKKETGNILLLQTTIVILHVMTELVSKRNNTTNLHLSLGDSICPWRLRRPVGIFLFLSDDVFLFLPPSVVSPSRIFLFPIFLLSFLYHLFEEFFHSQPPSWKTLLSSSVRRRSEEIFLALLLAPILTLFDICSSRCFLRNASLAFATKSRLSSVSLLSLNAHDQLLLRSSWNLHC